MKMSTPIEILLHPITLIGIIFILLYLLIKFWKDVIKLKSDKRSMSVIHGQSIEEIIPFSKNFPYDYRNFKFIGMPVDGIVFNDDKIVFVEIKTGSSRLSDKQEKIKDLVENKKVYWEEIKA